MHAWCQAADAEGSARQEVMLALAKRSFCFEPARGFFRYATGKYAISGHFVFDQLEGVGPEILLLHDRVNIRHAVVGNPFPMWGDGGQELFVMGNDRLRNQLQHFRILLRAFCDGIKLSPCVNTRHGVSDEGIAPALKDFVASGHDRSLPVRRHLVPRSNDLNLRRFFAPDTPDDT